MCSENEGADQLRGYREADQRLRFRYTYSAFVFATHICTCVFAYYADCGFPDAAAHIYNVAPYLFHGTGT